MAIRVRDPDPSRFSSAIALKTLFMLQDAFMVETGTVPGYVFLVDMKGCTIGHVPRVKISHLKLYSDYTQVHFHICYLMADNKMRII